MGFLPRLKLCGIPSSTNASTRSATEANLLVAFSCAVCCYNAVPCFRHDLAELLMKLRQFEKAERFLKAAIDEDSNGDAHMISEC